MKARLKIAETRTPDGSPIALYQHDRDFFMILDGQDLMDSRQNVSELELARLGCRHLTDYKTPSVLIGGLGMGYTLRQTLDMLGPDARVVVGELVDAVVEWNRTYLGALNAQPLDDPRVDLESGDIVDIISRSSGKFDAILIDIDYGPDAMTTGNHRLYGNNGIQACRRALTQNGCLAVWSAEASKKFEQLLVRNGLHVRRFRVPAGKGSKSQSRFVWVASEDKTRLPPGGGEPRLPEKKKAPIKKRRWPRKK